jgi:hypothetical protein
VRIIKLNLRNTKNYILLKSMLALRKTIIIYSVNLTKLAEYCITYIEVEVRTLVISFIHFMDEISSPG